MSVAVQALEAKIKNVMQQREQAQTAFHNCNGYIMALEEQIKELKEPKKLDKKKKSSAIEQTAE